MQVVQRYKLMLALLACTWTSGAESRGSDEAVMIARADVPNALIPQGEVQLFGRRGETIVQTVLHTRFPTRVKNSIIRKERTNWGVHPDAGTYIRNLSDAFSEYKKRRKTGSKDVALVIRFITGSGSSRVDFSFSALLHSKRGFHIQPADVWRSVSFAEDYIRRNQAYIVRDVFKKRAEELLNRLHEDRLYPGEIDNE